MRVSTKQEPAVLEIREVHCPNCGAPAAADSSTCVYCYARLPVAAAHGEVLSVSLVIFAFALVGVFALDFFLNIGLTAWIIDACGKLCCE